MHSNSTIVRVVAGSVQSIAVAAVLFGPLGAAAQSAGNPPAAGGTPHAAALEPGPTQGWGVQLGYRSAYRRATLAYETPNIWMHRFQNGWGRMDLNVELGLSYWEARRAHPKTMGQFSVIPMLRWWPNEGFYMEVGTGPTVLSRSEFAGRDLGTRFQFGSHLGAGVLLHKMHRIGIRYSHYSNAGIKKPNPGLDLFELVYTHQF